ncbi:MAG: molecular chaperone DnaJ [Clostridia bacterium]|nr:molecular chaperone DnaJ [Clostridia bacterium]
MDKRDYYEVMGLSKDATADDIKKAYRQLAKKYHPDLHPGDKECEEKFKELNEANEILSDPDKRAKYDQFGHAAFDPSSGAGAGGGASGFEGFSGGFGGFDDIIGSIFSGFGFGGGSGSQRRNASMKGEDIRLYVDLTLEEAAFGCHKDINVTKTLPCDQCAGTGSKSKTKAKCANCGGTGYQRRVTNSFLGQMVREVPCDNCGGKGFTITDPCGACSGRGIVRKTVKVSADFPKGINEGQSLKKSGQGNVGINGGQNGDLYLSVRIKPNSQFTRKDFDIYQTIYLTYPQLVLGTVVKVAGLDQMFDVKIPEGTPSGKEFRIAGRGVPVLNSKNQRGDMYVTVQVVIPSKLNDSQKAILREFDDATDRILSTDKQADPKKGFFGKFKK